jgi:DNA topoisomerase-1
MAKAAAADAGLRYVHDLAPGIRRIKNGKSFTYVHPDGKAVNDESTLKRIHGLVIPPAWTDVWICTHPNGHLQATGRDARNRKQYRYHAKWRSVRDRTKYDKLLEVGQLLPKIRKQVLQDLNKKGLPREKVLAAIVRILDLTHIRIGNEEYAKENNSYGLTTLRDKHVDIDGSTVRFKFKGKSGQHQDIHFKDPRIARIVQKCEELPGHELFAYVDDDGNIVDIASDNVNEYLKNITGKDITAKDFRTWGGTIQAALCLYKSGECDTELKSKRMMTTAVKEVAGFLGNRPATCKKYYIDPRIFSSYQERSLCSFLAKELTKKDKYSEDDLQPIEKAVMKLLKNTVD